MIRSCRHTTRLIAMRAFESKMKISTRLSASPTSQQAPRSSRRRSLWLDCWTMYGFYKGLAEDEGLRRSESSTGMERRTTSFQPNLSNSRFQMAIPARSPFTFVALARNPSKYRPGMTNERSWQDPNELHIPELRQALSAFAVDFDRTERRTLLFQRYVRLASFESPDSVAQWLELDSLPPPFPAPKDLVVPKLRIVLALHAVEYPAQASRGHLLQLYNSLAKRFDPSGPVRRTSVTVVIPSPRPPHPNQKKRKSNPDPKKRQTKSKYQTSSESLPQSSSPPPPSTNSNCPSEEALPSHVGRTRPGKIKTRENTFFRPYQRASEQRPASSRRTSATSKRRTLSRTSRSSEGYSLRKSPRLSAAREKRSVSHASQSTEGPSQGSDNEAVIPASEGDADIKDESDDDADVDFPSAGLEEMSTRTASSLASEATSAGDPSRESSFIASDDMSRDSRSSSQTIRLETPDSRASSSHLSSQTISPETPDSRASSQEAIRVRNPEPPFEAESPFEAAPTPRCFEEITFHTLPSRESTPADLEETNRGTRQSSSSSPSQQSSGQQSPHSLGNVPTPPGNYSPSQDDHPEPVGEASLPTDRDESDAPEESSMPTGREGSESSVSTHREASEEWSMSIHRDSETGRSTGAGPDSTQEVAEDDQSEGEQEEPDDESDVGHIGSEPNPDSTQDLVPDESQREISRSQSPSHQHRDQGTPRPPASSRKRKSEPPSQWPDPSELSRAQIEAYLDDYNVAHNAGTRIARLVGSYNLLRSTLSKDDKQRPSKRPNARASPAASISIPQRRRVRARVDESSDEESVGFIYRPAPRSRPISPASPASSSNYQPSVASTESSPTSISVHSSRSTRSTRRKSGSPIEHGRQKRAKKPSDSKTQTGTKKTKKTRRRGRPSLTRNHDEGDSMNFVPVLPNRSKKRPLADPLPKSARAKKTRPGPDDPSPSDLPTRPQASTSQEEPRFVPPQVNDRSNPGAPKKRKQNQAAHDSDALSPPGPKRTRAVTDDSSASPDRQTSRRARGRQGSTKRHRQNSYSVHPSLHDEDELARQEPHAPSRSRRLIRPSVDRRHDTAASSSDHHSPQAHSSSRAQGPSQVYDSDAHSTAVPRAKRKQPDHLSPSPERSNGKRRGGPRLSLIPTNAQVHRRRHRNNRVRRNSLVIRPSFNDEEEFVPEPHPSASGIVGHWRSSLPRDLSPPPPSSPLPGHDHPRAGPVAGCSCVGVGPEILSEITRFSRVTSRLADCVERSNMASLMQSTSRDQIPASRPSGYRDLSLLARVRLHVKTLFGKTMALNCFPRPATESEKANWKRNGEDDFPDEDDQSDCSSSSGYSGDDDDPGFPYPDGPGHREASTTALKIMWRSMIKRGVVSFRPDLSRGPRDVDNKFLWDLAHSIFIKLVKAQEYPEIDLDNCSEKKILLAIMNHAKQLGRTYREAGWDPRRLDKRAVHKRREARTKRLRQARAKFVTHKARLAPLLQVIKTCTSDAETEPNSPNDMDMGSDGEPEKRLAVHHLPWRHPRIGRAFQLIDRLIDLQRQSGSREYGKTSHARLRPRNPTISNRPAPPKLSHHAYCDEWIATLTVPQLDELDVQGHSLGTALKNLEGMV
ncbi:hypothetical protein PGTUg99_027797 [Puccinia graminis f. sp. tritici]|uniref:Uncharacterized protein n=1 Tax=Puccinia graminis f. sp. tritici TaxID=56615 RepID=A0A5B0MYJ9_PUCGR|nr:hypothetical protein PGTUg99_027797 [Puccinia graminis f. sp. tritici]